MGRNGGLGALIAVLGLAFIYSRPRGLPHETIIRTRGFMMPPHIIYPQVNDAGRLPPQTKDYERELEKKYPALLERTRVRYAKSRKILGLREYVAPPMPVEAGGIAPERVTR